MKSIAVIPARAGSKRLPGKNHREIAGKPLISWTVEAAIYSNLFEKVLVTTDSADVTKVCAKYDVEIFNRPSWTAKDNSTASQVLKSLYPRLIGFADVCYLQPTSPLRGHQHIIEAYEKLRQVRSGNLVSVTETRLPAKYFFFESDDKIKTLSQQLNDTDTNKRLIFPNGAIYISKIENLVEREFNLVDRIESVYIMSQIDSVDIDYESDVLLAEYLLNKKYH